jgi:tetratricopeptide (TPR) repeat protein
MNPTYKRKSVSLLISLILLTTLILYPALTNAQIKLNGTYVATKITYLSDDELPDDNVLKYSYVKYTFSNPDKLNYASVYHDLGTPFLFEVKGNLLLLKNDAGFVMNTMRIIEHTPEKLLLASASQRGDLEDPKAIKYTLHSEKLVQKSLALSPDDIFSIKETDTTYKSGQKIYAQFKGPAFQTYIYDRIRNNKKDVKSGEFDCTFIIDANGKPDSLRIIQGINPKFDAEYIKAFNSAKNMWIPAQHNGKNVKVLMNLSLQYFTSDQAIPSYFNGQKANAAYQNKDYELALFYYDKALEAKGDDTDNLYKRGICKQMLGNIKGACTDWNRIKQLGKNIADELLLKYCK